MTDDVTDERADPAPGSDGAEPLVVYADYVCPFCYLGKVSLARYREDAADPPPVEWRPFDLRAGRRGPGGDLRDDVDDGKDEAYYERARRNVERLRDRYGVEMTIGASRDVDSWNAQQAALYARRECDPASARAFHDALYDALWRDGRDVGDPDVLAAVADGTGVPPGEVRAAVSDDDLAADLAARFDAARRAGVSAVPTFVRGGRVARGAVAPDRLRQLVEE